MIFALISCFGPHTLAVSGSFPFSFSIPQHLKLFFWFRENLSERNMCPIIRSSVFSLLQYKFYSTYIACSQYCLQSPSISILDVTRIYKAEGWEIVCHGPYLELSVAPQFSHLQLVFHSFQIVWPRVLRFEMSSENDFKGPSYWRLCDSTEPSDDRGRGSICQYFLTFENSILILRSNVWEFHVISFKLLYSIGVSNIYTYMGRAFR